mgnify:CR=1
MIKTIKYYDSRYLFGVFSAFDIMKSSDKDSGSSSQFIWGYVFK